MVSQKVYIMSTNFFKVFSPLFLLYFVYVFLNHAAYAGFIT